ncbi:MAG: glycosyltransferase family 2 protein, partial [Clostridia bacterium]|nr:glycosyltransferase family 2 protein [Clostridia bacterium]
MSRDNVLVSVVIPTYRRTVEYVSKAVESVINQTYQNVEIIVIDDSTSAYEKQNETENYFTSLNKSNVIYLQNEENLGGSLTRNRGIEAASGDYITFLDDDDEYQPEKIERQLNFMLGNGCDMTFTDLAIYTPDGTMVDYREYSKIERFDNDYLLR